MDFYKVKIQAALFMSMLIMANVLTISEKFSNIDNSSARS